MKSCGGCEATAMKICAEMGDVSGGRDEESARFSLQRVPVIISLASEADKAEFVNSQVSTD